MNGFFNKLRNPRTRKKGVLSLAVSVVILLELLAFAFLAVHAWVETVSSIKITNQERTTGSIGNYTKYTDMMIGEKPGTIDLLDYFTESGDMHLAPASSADGTTFFFPKVYNYNSQNPTYVYRKGNSSDKNTTYLSVTFRLKADANADFFFWKDATHDISVSDDIRVSVTAYTEGENPEGTYDTTSGKLISNTKIYANNASTTAVVNSTTGATGATTVEKFTDHQKGKSTTARLFAVGANETKYVTINVWLQKKTANNNDDLTQNMSVSQAINNLGITSSLTPRHVTLIPTPTWDTSGTNEYYYAWCWMADEAKRANNPSRLYGPMTLDEYEHYSFDYNGTFDRTLFLRSGKDDLTKEYLEGGHWNDNTVWNVTEDTSIPNDPVDPTFIIKTINGSTQTDTSSGTSSTAKKSTGEWVDPATVKVAYVTDQSSWGAVSATSYIGSNTSSHVMEQTNTNNPPTVHTNTVHAWPGKIVSLTASAKTNYAFVGWYTDAAGTIPASTVNSTAYTASTYKPNAPSTASEITYYAKFKETRMFTLNRLVDGNASSTVAAGTLTVNSSTTGNTATSKSVTVDKGSSVTFSASAATGYTLDGIYTTATGSTIANSPLTLNSNTTYYARFTTNSYNVTANAYYSTNGGTSYSAGSTGGTVEAGSSAAGATSTASVKYKSSVNLVATPASGYEFVGWYSAASGGTQLSTNTTHSYTMNATSAQNVYARFIRETWEIGHGTSGGSNWSYNSMSVSGNTVTGTLTLTEGQDFSFKIRKTVGSTSTYYGANNASYSNITSTSFISNLSLTNNNGSEYDIYMKGHAGTYTFEFNKSTNVLNVTASYSNITITLNDVSSNKWLDDNDAIFYLDCSGYSGIRMTAGTNKWTASIPSNTRVSGITFKRNNPGNTETWNSWSWNRGYATSYDAS